MKEVLWCFPPAATDGGDGFEAAWGELAGARVAAIHSPVEEVDLVGIELKEQDDDFAAKLVDLRQWQSGSCNDSESFFFLIQFFFLNGITKVLQFVFQRKKSSQTF